MEIGGWSPAMVVLDAMEKTAGVRVLQSGTERPSRRVFQIAMGRLADIQAAAAGAETDGRSHAGRR